MGRQQGEEEVHVPCENNNLNGKLGIEVLRGSRTLSAERGGQHPSSETSAGFGVPSREDADGNSPWSCPGGLLEGAPSEVRRGGRARGGEGGQDKNP